MRRSKAPSIVNKSKRFCNNQDGDANGSSDPEDESYKWGSKDNPSVEQNDYCLKNKRIFNIVWRDISNKKHKTWKGDGTLEINSLSMKAVLKDETGKYMGCSTKFKLSELQQDYQMTVAGKEIEIQNEIKDEEEIYETRRNQMKNRNWGSEEWVSAEERDEEAKKPKGGFYFKPLLVLKQPQLQKTPCVRDATDKHKWSTESEESVVKESNWDSSKHLSNINEKSKVDFGPKMQRRTNVQSSETIRQNFSRKQHNEFMCFIKPSELQQYLFQQINEYYGSNEKYLNGKESSSLDIQHILEQICNHPSFIKHSTNCTNLVQFLMPSLPDWSEMGPFDSGKLEFVQYFLQTCGGTPREHVIIIAKHLNVQNMLQGLCDYMNIRCFRLNAQDSQEIQERILKKYLEKAEENATNVLLTSSILPLKDYGARLKLPQLIVFENILAIMDELKHVKTLKFAKMFYLVTAFSVEEFLILPNVQTPSDSIKEILNLVNSHFDDRFCYVHSKIKCTCHENMRNKVSNGEYEVFTNWEHLAPPFNEEFLKVSGLDNSAQNLITIFMNTN